MDQIFDVILKQNSEQLFKNWFRIKEAAFSRALLPVYSMGEFIQFKINICHASLFYI